MRSLNVVMVKCPNTGRELSTGIEMDATTFKRLPDIRSQLMCPACNFDNVGRRAMHGSVTRLLPSPRFHG